MHLTVFNGSPRGTGSNTKVLLEHFNRGFLENPQNQVEAAFLNRVKELDKHVEMFRSSEHVILAFPLYTDAMPGIVKNFIEALPPLCGLPENPTLGFIVQSGFPEPIHSRYVERYLAKLASRLGCAYHGTAVRGGVEGCQIQPAWMTRKLFKGFYLLGRNYTSERGFDAAVLDKLAPREKMSGAMRVFFRLLNRAGMTNFYWNHQLKQNQAFDLRFDRPFLEKAPKRAVRVGRIDPGDRPGYKGKC